MNTNSITRYNQTAMKKIMVGIFITFLSEACYTQSSVNITDLNNHSLNVNDLAGKKIVIIFLPVVQDTSLAAQLTRFENKYSDSATVIGLVCLSGCNLSSATVLSWYAGAIDAGLFITTGSTEGDNSDARQSTLKWLSNRNINNRQTETTLPGSKYFLSKQGKMYAQLGPQASLDSKMADNIIKTKVPGEN
jgi:hypothetical protein